MSAEYVTHHLDCGAVYVPALHVWRDCDCDAIRDTTRIQTETTLVLAAMTDSEKDDVLAWLVDHAVDVLREALNETEQNR